MSHDRTPGTRAEPIVFFDAAGNGPYFHACQGANAVRSWLDRQITTGQVTPAERAAIERMLDDMTEQDFCDCAYNGIIPPDALKRRTTPAAPPEGSTPTKEDR